MTIFDSGRTECLAQIYDPRIRPWLKGYLYDHLDGILDIVVGNHGKFKSSFTIKNIV